MINSLDILSNLATSMTEKINDISTVIDAMSDLVDMSTDVMDVVAGTAVELTPIDANILNDVVTRIAGRTYTLADGTVTALATEATSKGLSLIDSTRNRIALKIEEGMFWFYGLTPAGFTFGDFTEELANTFTQSTIVRRAINLVEKGELTTSNFMTAVSDISAKANVTISAMISQIADAIQGTNPASQATALLASLRTMWSGVKDASTNAEDTAIEFSDSSYTVSTSILFPTNVLITAASAVLASLISFISPVFGVAIGLIGSAVGQAVTIINDNNSTEYRLAEAEERDNDCYATPLVQRTLAYTAIPIEYRSLLDKHGYVKLINGACTMYLWKTSETMTKIEVFGCANSDIARHEQDIDLLEKQIFASATYLNHVVTLRIPVDVARLQGVMTRWLEDPSMAGGNGPTCDELISQYDTTAAFNKISARYMTLVAMFVYVYWVISDQEGRVYESITDQTWLRPDKRYTNDQILASYMSYLNGVGSSFINNPYGKDYKQLIAGLVNNVIPSVRAVYSELNEADFVNLISLFPIYDPNDTTRVGNGQGMSSYVSYSIANKANAYVYPPKSTVSIWARVAVSLLIVVTTAVTAAIISSKVKKKIQYKAFTKRQELKKLSEKVAKGGSYDDWLKATKATKKYNRFLGRLSGTQFDFNNSWIEYSANSAVDSGLLSSLINKSNKDGKAELSVADYTVRKLIDKNQ